MEVDLPMDLVNEQLDKLFLSESKYFLEHFNEEIIETKESNDLLNKLINLHKDKQSNPDFIKTVFSNIPFSNESEDIFRLFEQTIDISRLIFKNKHVDFSLFTFFKEETVLPLDLLYLFEDRLEEFFDRFLTKLIPLEKEDDFTQNYLDKFTNFITDIFLSVWLENFSLKAADKARVYKRFDIVWLKRKLFNFRKSKFFSMLVYFPESKGSLDDMKYSFTCVPVKIEAIEFLEKEIEQRLTHTGVHTDEILVSYESIILALRYVDPTYITQVVVCKPIAEYLRTRSDAIKCIVERIWDWFSSTFAESCTEKMETNSLKDEGMPNSFSNHDLNSTSQNAVDSDDEFVYVDHHFVGKPHENNVNYLKIRQHYHDKWNPEPIESVCLASQLANRNLDMLSTMMSIYESKKDFLSEYMKQLANHLLKFTSFEDQRILFSKQLKLFKYRFSVLDLHFCDVMLQDVENSEDWFRQFTSYSELKNSMIGEENYPLKALVISSFYWPELLDDNFMIPDDLLEPFKNYSSFFESRNEGMCVKWLCRYGTVEIDIKLPNGKVVPYTLEPIEACIAHLFSKKAKYSLAELSSELKAANLSTVKRALKFFLNNGILKMKKLTTTKASNIMEAANSEMYEIVDNRFLGGDDDKMVGEKEFGNSELENQNREESANENNLAAGGQNEEHSIEEENEVYWSYINGMLVNLGALSLDKILSMLQIFTSAADESSAPINKASLQAFLNKKIVENEISLEGGLYRLVKK